MGKGFWVLIWDGWGTGLNMINPRLYTDDEGNNWFPYEDEIDKKDKLFHIKRKNEPYMKVLDD